MELELSLFLQYNPNMAETRIRIQVVEDDSVLRRTLVELLRLEADLLVVSEASNGEQAVAEAMVVRPDVILMDIQMPRMNGIDATRQLKEKLPEAHVVMLTKFGDDENVFAAIKAGALGYVLKDAGLDEIARVVRSAKIGDGSLSPASQSALHNRQLFAELSRREVEVLECIAAGMKNTAIADKLFLSEKTVKSHVGSIFKKLQVNDRTEAAILAQQHGLSI
jgi:NarL family two-component system response regulator LiaR